MATKLKGKGAASKPTSTGRKSAAVNLTDEICFAVFIIGGIRSTAATKSGRDGAIKLLGCLDESLIRSNGLIKAAVVYRKVYKANPRPIGDIHAASYHELGRGLASGFRDGARHAADWRANVRLLADPSASFDAKLYADNWAAVCRYLLRESPEFDVRVLRKLVAKIEKEGALATEQGRNQP